MTPQWYPYAAWAAKEVFVIKEMTYDSSDLVDPSAAGGLLEVHSPSGPHAGADACADRQDSSGSTNDDHADSSPGPGRDATPG